MAPIPHVEVVFGEFAKQAMGNQQEILVPREILMRLLDLYISCWDFDEEWYLATYPDIADAIKHGQFKSGWNHFRSIGYLEGRLGTQPIVDPDWYISKYSDVAGAMLDGKVTSAAEHYSDFGYSEGRLPHNPGVQARWYAPRYLNSSAINDETACSDHFVKSGYRKLAVPAPPR
jgi:hypothetical protein